MPNNSQIILIEQTLLSKIVQDTELLFQVSREDWISATAKNLHTAIEELYSNETPINSRNLTIEVNKVDNLDEQSVQMLFETETDTDDESSFDYVYEEMRKERVKHSLKTDVMGKLTRELEKKSDFDPSKVQELALTISEEILSLDSGRENLIMDIPEMLDKYIAVLNKRRSGKMFFDTGCAHLNRALTEGFAPQKITTLFGASGVGKSTYALYLVNKQINKHIPSVYISLEMDLISTMDRLIAQRNRINMEYLLPKYNEDEMIEDAIIDMVEQERIKMAKNKNFFFVEKPGLTLSDILYIIKEAKSRLGVDYLIVTIDLITMIRDFNAGKGSKADDYENAMNHLHEIVKSTNCHIVGVVQGRRPSSRIQVDSIEDLEKFRPRIEEIKNSAALEEPSRIILSTFRAKHYAERLLKGDPEVEIMEDIMDIDILKQNMGSLERLNYLFNPKKSLIMPYVPPEDDDDDDDSQQASVPATVPDSVVDITGMQEVE